MNSTKIDSRRIVIGWREWTSLPDINIPAIKFKTDTGAKTSSLHCFEQKIFEKDGRQWVRFGIHPVQKRTDIEVFGEAPVIDFRKVINSGGVTEERPFIKTTIVLGDTRWEIELNLTNRDSMKFRMLLGREAMNGRIIVDPSLSYNLGRMHSAEYYK